MNLKQWVGIGVFSLAMAGSVASATDFQQWRPPMLGMPAAIPMAPMPPAMPLHVHDPRFRPVPAAEFMNPRKAQVPVYPGRPFVSVQGQNTGSPAVQPAYAKQYAWRPADRPSPAATGQVPGDKSAYSPMLTSVPGVPAYPMPAMPGVYGAYGHPMPFGMLPPPPPPPMPYPGAFGMASGFPAPFPHAGLPGAGYAAPFPPPPPWLGGGNHMAQPGVFGYPPVTPWAAPWTAARAWSRPDAGYGSFASVAPVLGGVRSTYPLAGLY